MSHIIIFIGSPPFPARRELETRTHSTQASRRNRATGYLPAWPPHHETPCWAGRGRGSVWFWSSFVCSDLLPHLAGSSPLLDCTLCRRCSLAKVGRAGSRIYRSGTWKPHMATAQLTFNLSREERQASLKGYRCPKASLSCQLLFLFSCRSCCFFLFFFFFNLKVIIEATELHHRGN